MRSLSIVLVLVFGFLCVIQIKSVKEHTTHISHGRAHRDCSDTCIGIENICKFHVDYTVSNPTVTCVCKVNGKCPA